MKKIFGLALLLGCLIIIFYSLYSSYNIFTNKATVPEIFKTEEKILAAPKDQGIEAQMQQLIQGQLQGILPVDSIPRLLNLISWSIFAGILIFGGSQISGLGIKLIK